MLHRTFGGAALLEPTAVGSFPPSIDAWLADAASHGVASLAVPRAAGSSMESQKAWPRCETWTREGASMQRSVPEAVAAAAGPMACFARHGATEAVTAAAGPVASFARPAAPALPSAVGMPPPELPVMTSPRVHRRRARPLPPTSPGANLKASSWSERLRAQTTPQTTAATCAEMRFDGIVLEKSSYHGLIDEHLRAGRAACGVEVLLAMTSEGLQPDHAYYVRLMGASARQPRAGLSRAVFWRMREAGLADVRAYTQLIDLEGQAGRYDSAWRIFSLMGRDGVVANVVTYGALMHVCAKAAWLQRASQVMSTMRAAQVTPNARVYNSLLNVCARAHDANAARHALSSMQADGVTPDAITYATYMRVLVVTGEVPQVWQLFAAMMEQQLSLDASGYAALIVLACRTGNRAAVDPVLAAMARDNIELEEHEGRLLQATFGSPSS